MRTKIEYVDARTIAARLGVHPKTVRNKVKAGVWPEPDICTGGIVRWDWDKFEEVINCHLRAED